MENHGVEAASRREFVQGLGLGALCASLASHQQRAGENENQMTNRLLHSIGPVRGIRSSSAELIIVSGGNVHRSVVVVRCGSKAHHLPQMVVIPLLEPIP